MLARGYALVRRDEIALNPAVSPLNKELGENIGVYVGTNASGGAMRAYLMKIPLEIYKKYKDYEQKHNDDIEAAIRRGVTGKPEEYVPRATPIRYNTNRRPSVPS